MKKRGSWFDAGGIDPGTTELEAARTYDADAGAYGSVAGTEWEAEAETSVLDAGAYGADAGLYDEDAGTKDARAAIGGRTNRLRGAACKRNPALMNVSGRPGGIVQPSCFVWLRCGLSTAFWC